MPFAENLGTGGGSLDAQYGSSPTANTNAPLLLDPRTSGNFVYTPGTAGNYVAVPHSSSLNILGIEGTPFLSLPGVAGNIASTPDVAALNITGDIDLVVRVAMDDWTPSTTRNLLGKRSGATAATAAYEFLLDPSGFLVVQWWDTNTGNFRALASSASVVAADGSVLWVRTTLDVDNGSVQCAAAFYTSTDGLTWSALGATQTSAGVAAISAAPVALAVGAQGSLGGAPAAGKFYRAIVRNGIGGTAVFDADFTQQALGSRGFIESTGKLVSLVGNAAQIVDGTTYGFMPGVNGAYWSAPDSAALSITGDIDIRARISLNDWTPSAEQVLVGKWLATGNQRSYSLRLTTGGTFYVTTSNDGTAAVTTTANAANTLTNGQTYWIRATLDVDDGAGNRVANFYFAPDSETEPTVWTSIGTTVTVAGTTSIFDGTAALEIGSFNGGSSPAAGRLYRVIIRPNLTSGTKVLDADFTRQLQFASTFTEGSSQLATVTTVGAARIERDRDLEIVTRFAADSWNPSTNQLIINKVVQPGTANQVSYYLRLIPGPYLELAWSVNGSAVTSAFTDGPPPALTGLVDGQAYWIKATLDVNNGSNGRTVRFYTAPDSPTEPTVWTQVGAASVATGATSIFPSVSRVEVGSASADTSSFYTAGKMYRAIIRNGINGPAVLDIDFTDAITTGAETYLPDTPSEVIPEALQYLPNLGWGGTALNARFGSAVGADTNDPLLLTHTGENYLYLSGVAGNACTGPHLASQNPSGNVEFIARFSMPDFTPSVSTLIYFKSNSTNAGFYVQVLTDGRLIFAWGDGVGLNVWSTTIASATPFRDGEWYWVRATLTLSTGVVEFSFANDSTAIPTSWAVIPTVYASGATGATTVATTTSDIQYGPQNAPQLLKRVIVRGGGVDVVDANFVSGITSGAQTSFTATVGGTVNIGRSTSGRKSVAVVQDVLLFGTDDYLEVPDSDLLDFGATDSFTVMSVARLWPNTTTTSGNFATTVSKFNRSGGGPGWDHWFSTTQFQPAVNDVSNVSGQSVSSFTASGTNSVFLSVIDETAETITSYVNGVAGTSPSTSAVGSRVNGNALRIGATAGAGLPYYTNMEFRGSAVWRRALTTAEVALVNTHYTTGPTAASTALMQQAVFWIDAGTRSVAQINRSTSGRKSVACARCTWLLGTDDYFEVPASNLFDFAQGQDYTLLVLHRGWWAQGTNDTLLATSSSTTASAAGWAMSNSSGDPWQAGGRHGDGSNGVTAVAPRRDVGALTGTFLVRDTATDTLTAFTGSTSGTPVTDTTTGTIGNTNVMRLGRLSTTGAEYLDAEVVAAVVWRRKLTTAERNAVLAYYGV